MKIDIHNELVDKSKTKKNGIYSYKNYLYAVKDNNFIAYADHWGNIISIQGIFHSQVGKCEICDRKKKLLEYMEIR